MIYSILTLLINRHHRQWIVTRILDIHVTEEIQTLDALLVDEEKNYHCWSYRQWFVTRHQLWTVIINSFLNEKQIIH